MPRTRTKDDDEDDCVCLQMKRLLICLFFPIILSLASCTQIEILEPGPGGSYPERVVVVRAAITPPAPGGCARGWLLSLNLDGLGAKEFSEALEITPDGAEVSGIASLPGRGLHLLLLTIDTDADGDPDGIGSAAFWAVGTQAAFDLSGDGGLFDLPFPFDLRRHPDGRPKLDDFPNPFGNFMVSRYVEAADAELTDFGVQSGVFLRFDGRIDPSTLPADPAESLEPMSPIFLIHLGPDRGRVGERAPIEVKFIERGGKYHPANLLAALPVQGMPLRPASRYGLVVTRAVEDVHGLPLAPPAALSAFARGEVPDCPLCPEAAPLFEELFEVLEAEGIGPDEVAAATVYTTADPVARDFRLRDFMASLPAPEPAGPLERIETYEDFTFVRGEFPIPLLQDGSPPYALEGGAIRFDAFGDPIVQGEALDRVAFALPHGPMPPEGWPVMMYFHGGGGTYDQVIHRGRRPAPDESADPGTGPALIAARRGWASIGWDGALCGARGVGDSSLDEILFFNVFNPYSFRDNIRQAAAEAALLANLLETIEIEAALCPDCETGGEPIRFDTSRLITMGQSTGSTVSPLFLASDPRPVAGILSGAGGSFILNVEQKESPLDMRAFAGLLLGVPPEDLDRFHPLLSLYSMFLDPAEPISYGPYIIHAPRAGMAPKHIYMTLGILDHYMLPDIANALAVSVGLDLVEPVIEASSARAVELAGGRIIEAPVEGNLDTPHGPVTGVLVQYLEDGILDGHHVIFQLEEPKYQYGCFLESYLPGACPSIPVPIPDSQAPCR